MVVASLSTGTMGDVQLIMGGWWSSLDISAVGRLVSCLPRMLYCTARNLFTPTGTLTVSRKYKQTNRQLLLYSLPMSCKDTGNGCWRRREVIVALKPNVQTVFNTPQYLDENYPFLYPYICYSKAGKLLLPDQIPCTAGAFFVRRWLYVFPWTMVVVINSGKPFREYVYSEYAMRWKKIMKSPCLLSSPPPPLLSISAQHPPTIFPANKEV